MHYIHIHKARLNNNKHPARQLYTEIEAGSQGKCDDALVIVVGPVPVLVWWIAKQTRPQYSDGGSKMCKWRQVPSSYHQ